MPTPSTVRPNNRKKDARPTAKPRRPPDRERTHRRLLQVAIRLFAQRGFHGVSVDDIAAAARLSKRLPYYYFGSKQGLYRAVLMEVYQRIEGIEFQAVAEKTSPSEKLEALVTAYFKFLRENPEFTQLLLWGNLEKGRYFPKGLLTKMPMLQRLSQIVEEGVASGEFRDDLDTSHLLINVIGLAFIYFSNQFSLSQVLEIDLSAPPQQVQAVRQVKAVLLDGLRAPGFKRT